MSQSHYNDALRKSVAQVDGIQSYYKMLLKGRRCRIESDYNGQPYGRSARSLKGKEYVIEDVIVTAEGAEIKLEGFRLFIDAEEVFIL